MEPVSHLSPGHHREAAMNEPTTTTGTRTIPREDTSHDTNAAGHAIPGLPPASLDDGPTRHLTVGPVRNSAFGVEELSW
jgi:hypothetical protein